MIEYKLIRKINELVKYHKVSIELNVMKWSNMPEKYDIRKWENGEPKKGISLDEKQAKKLLVALADEFNCKIDKSFRDEVETLNAQIEEDDPFKGQLSFDDIE